ncbi:hypothetical protein [Moritella sp.]|uniref:hypothetical protein n=1 Tax=Moritella sp. TaxID=78556 RepID=UPI0025ED5710|nr:hypothetical protein [Moritella sp.]MCJ8352305.1 hypothetical protein [Moritella sp.]
MIYFKKPKDEMDIIICGKSQEQISEDQKNGVSRFGGDFRQPNYSHAYFNSAKILLDNALKSEQLDEFGLPIFYMVRHTLELNLKNMLSLAYDVLKMRHELYGSQQAEDQLPSNKELKRFESSHDIAKLYTDLKSSCRKLGIGVPEKYFSVIKSILHYEVTPTWSRYNKSNKGLHMATEVILPIVSLVKDLESLLKVVSYNIETFNGSLESELYEEFDNLTIQLEYR